MSTYEYPDPRVAHWYRLYCAARNEMDYQTKRLLADLAASVMVLVLAARYAADPTIAIAVIGLINTLNFTEALRALREAQLDNQRESADRAGE